MLGYDLFPTLQTSRVVAGTTATALTCSRISRLPEGTVARGTFKESLPAAEPSFTAWKGCRPTASEFSTMVGWAREAREKVATQATSRIVRFQKVTICLLDFFFLY